MAQNTERDVMITKADYNKVTKYIPVCKKHQVIRGYDETQHKYMFDETDRRKIQLMTSNRAVVDIIIDRIMKDSSLNPEKNLYTQVITCFLYAIFIMIFFILLYVFFGIIIFFLGDPVICFLYCYFIFYQVWYRFGRVGIALLREKNRSKPLERYLNSQNKKVFDALKVHWSVVQNGNYIQVDNNNQKFNAK